jgi:radical SAM superfamily enzyme YgiQ (UPF0313 family)
LRPDYEDVIDQIKAYGPDIFAVSAVVSTSYKYVRKLTLDVRKFCPKALIIIGGNMAASAEVLLRRTGADLCAIGEGEKILMNVANRALKTGSPSDFNDIPGLLLLDDQQNLVFTGYENQLSADEVYEVDWNDLVKSSVIDQFIQDIYDANGDMLIYFKHDERARQPHRAKKKFVLLPCSKGCVAKCTFCHRWGKGIRYIPVEVLMKRIGELVAQFNVGFFNLADENFGTDRKWLRTFCQEIKQFDVLWHVGGMRVNCISPENIDMMKDAGCVTILYGMESGSSKMLKVMEKKTTVEQNRDAMKWTIERGLWTGVQLVLGMPGETPGTIKETIEFAKYAMTLSSNQNPNDLSINYAQALPGTPLYEFGRHRDLIGPGLEGEEAYLLRISDKDAHDEISTLNFTDYPKLVCDTWRPRITIEANFAYVKKFGIDQYMEKLLNDTRYFKRIPQDTGYFANPKRLVDTSVMTDVINKRDDDYHEFRRSEKQLPKFSLLVRQRKFGLAIICYPILAYRFRHFLFFLVLLKAFVNGGARYMLSELLEYVAYYSRIGRNRRIKSEIKSLRKIIQADLGKISGDKPAMEPLRNGR